MMATRRNVIISERGPFLLLAISHEGLFLVWDVLCEVLTKFDLSQRLELGCVAFRWRILGAFSALLGVL